MCTSFFSPVIVELGCFMNLITKWYKMFGIYYMIMYIIFFAFVFYLFIYFIILYWFCHTSTWIHHGCTHVPNPEPPSHLPPHTISLGHPSAPAPSILYPALNLDWRFMFFKYWALSQLFYSPLSPSSKGSLVPLHFCHLSDIICISEVIDISPSNLDSSLWPTFLMMYSA